MLLVAHDFIQMYGHCSFFYLSLNAYNQERWQEVHAGQDDMQITKLFCSAYGTQRWGRRATADWTEKLKMQNRKGE